MLTKIKSLFKGENIQAQYKVLGYMIDLNFHDYKLAIEIEEHGHSNRNIGIKKIKGNKTKTWLGVC